MSMSSSLPMTLAAESPLAELESESSSSSDGSVPKCRRLGPALVGMSPPPSSSPPPVDSSMVSVLADTNETPEVRLLVLLAMETEERLESVHLRGGDEARDEIVVAIADTPEPADADALALEVPPAPPPMVVVVAIELLLPPLLLPPLPNEAPAEACSARMRSVQYVCEEEGGGGVWRPV